MTELDTYLATHYLDEVQLAAASGLSIDEHRALIRDRLVPDASYVVSDTGTLSSFVFGEMPAPGSKRGHYFHPSQLAWIARARSALADGAAGDTEARLKEQFAANFAAALSALNLSTWRLRDSFDDHGAAIPEGLRTRTDTAWTYFLNGTFGLCVANPISEAHIAHKEVLQEKLTQVSENGSKHHYSPSETSSLRGLIDAYAAAAMPFSPVEYPRSSRKRLVEDLLAHLGAYFEPI